MLLTTCHKFVIDNLSQFVFDNLQEISLQVSNFQEDNLSMSSFVGKQPSRIIQLCFPILFALLWNLFQTKANLLEARAFRLIGSSEINQKVIENEPE